LYANAGSKLTRIAYNLLISSFILIYFKKSSTPGNNLNCGMALVHFNINALLKQT